MAKVVILISVLAICHIRVDGQIANTRGIRIAIPQNRITTLPTCDGSSTQRQCSGCDTVLFCTSSSEPLGQFKCPSVLPYCIDGKCTATSTSCTSPSFLCPLGGNDQYYPDPTNCSNYFYCENSQALIGYSCPVNFPFDITTQQCASGIPCRNIDCTGRIVAINPQYPSLGVLCSNNKIVLGSYTACPANHQLDQSTLECEPKCTSTGLIENINDNTKYYRCLPTGPWGAYQMTSESCPPNQQFNPDRKLCERIPSTTMAPPTTL